MTCFKVHYLGQGWPLVLLAAAVKKPSYATGTWPAFVEYQNKLHLILCAMYTTSLNVYASIDMGCFTALEILISLMMVQLKNETCWRMYGIK